MESIDIVNMILALLAIALASYVFASLWRIDKELKKTPITVARS